MAMRGLFAGSPIGSDARDCIGERFPSQFDKFGSRDRRRMKAARDGYSMDEGWYSFRNSSECVEGASEPCLSWSEYSRFFREMAGRFDGVVDRLAQSCSSCVRAPRGFWRRRRIRMPGTPMWRSWGNTNFVQTARFAMGWVREAVAAARI